jgi:hypothetical protein
MMISFHSMEYYCQWHLSQYSDSLEAGPYMVCFLAEVWDLLSIQTSDQPLAHLASCSVDVVDPSPALKQLMHEADHLYLFSAEVTDECSCNCASTECLHVVHRETLPFTIVLEEWLQYLRDIILPYRKWGCCGVMEQCVILQYCVVSKKQNVVIWWSVSSMEACKPLCLLVFLLCNA